MIRFFASLLFITSIAAAAPVITIVIGEKAPPLEKLAADQLRTDLGKLFEAECVIETKSAADAAHTILLGSPKTNAAIPRDAWPKLGNGGHVVRSTKAGLIVGGDGERETFWASCELEYHFGIRHMLHGDFFPVEKPALKFDGIDIVLSSQSKSRYWHAFNGSASGMDSWSAADADRLLLQLLKLKFTGIVVPAQPRPFAAISLDGDSGGRTAFRGAKVIENPDVATVVEHLKTKAAELGLGVLSSDAAPGDIINLGAPTDSVLPQFSLAKLEAEFRANRADGFVARAAVPGDLNAAAHFISRASFDPKLTMEKSLNALVTPICGEGVVERLMKGFGHIEQAAKLIADNDPKLAVPDPQMLMRHTTSAEPPPAWWAAAKDHYTQAMNEMYRANTRARGGARPFILYHAKRCEFALHYFTALDALRKAGNAKAASKEDDLAASQEAALEATYNSLNALADVARDASDRGVIALMNANGYHLLLKWLEGN